MCSTCENFYKKQLRGAVLKEQAKATEEAAQQEAKKKRAYKKLSWRDVEGPFDFYHNSRDEQGTAGLPGDSADDVLKDHCRGVTQADFNLMDGWLEGISDAPTLQARPKKIYEITLGLDVEHGETLTIDGTRYLMSKEVTEWLRSAFR